MEREDTRGQVMHAVIGSASVVMLTGPTSVVEFAVLPVGLFWLIRWGWSWRGARWVFVTPVFLIGLALFAWQALSLAWSPDRHVGVEEMGTARFAWGVGMLFCVLNRRRWFVYALAAGFLLGNVSQLLHAMGREWSWMEWATWPRKAERNSGWWDPAVGGTLLVAALGLHLPAAVMGRGRERVVGVVLSLVTLVAVFATGTRGAWLGSAALVGMVVVVGVWRLVVGRSKEEEVEEDALTPALSQKTGRGGADHRAMWRRAAVAMAVALALLVGAGGVAWAVAGKSIEARYVAGREEIRRALKEGDFNSDTGARLAMAVWAWEMFRDHPVRGVGVGGYRHAVEQKLRERGADPATRSVHDHAHNTVLHAAATTGLVGAGLLGAFLIVGGVGLVRSIGPGRLGTYDAGSLFALVGLVLMGAFDSIQVNAQTAGLMWLLVGLGQAPKWQRANSK